MSWWFPGGFVVTLPCDREAAIAALNAAISSAKRSIYLSSGVALIITILAVGMVSSITGFAELGGFFTLFILVFIAMAALIPVMAYAQTRPWIAYLEELREGLETGRIRIEDVCGTPIYWTRPRRPYTGP